MTEGPGLEPWLANGFPPPSFVVEAERVAVTGAGPPLQGRLLVGGAILGAILLVAGLILMARSGGDDQTALNTAPATPTFSVPVVTFPPFTLIDPSELIPEETLPTLPVAPQTPIFPITPAPGPGPGPGTTQRPTTTKKPGGLTSVPPRDTNTTTSTSTPSSTSTPPTTAPAPLKVSPAVGGMYRVDGSDPCSEGWTIRARVTAGLPIQSVKVQFDGGDPNGVDMVREPGQDTWRLTRPSIDRPAEVFKIVATTDGQTTFSGAEKVDCPLVS